MAQRQYRRPDGAYTQDLKEYIDFWKHLAVDIEKGLEWKLVAFDPDLMFIDKRGSSFKVPKEIAYFIKRLKDN